MKDVGGFLAAEDIMQDFFSLQIQLSFLCKTKSFILRINRKVPRQSSLLPFLGLSIMDDILVVAFLLVVDCQLFIKFISSQV